jgi:hypothetical protein
MNWAFWLILIVAVTSVTLLWAQLMRWKKWADEYRAWVSRNCSCQQPGGDAEPKEPTWP